jgi:hypothetical protein
MAIFSPLLEGQFCSRELQLLTVPYKQYFSFSYRRNLPLPSFSVAKMKTQIVISVGGDSPRRCSWSKYFFPCYQFWFLKIIIHCRGIGSSFADRIDLLSIPCTCIEELKHINFFGSIEGIAFLPLEKKYLEFTSFEMCIMSSDFTS